mmetsp:Transcript_57571/g.141170  ORF Transcript_57571/g.141170 Transcript_57571/m.141170 type:complete len:382 (-) Transcript_57571:12-1157(-)
MRRIGEWMAYHRAPSTLNQYAGVFLRVSKWAAKVGENSLPMSPFVMARYMLSLGDRCLERGLTRASVDAACVAVAFMHKTAGETSPTEHPLVSGLKQAMGRRLGTGGKQVAPLTDEMVRRLYESVKVEGEELSTENLSFLTRVAVLHDGMLRWDGGERITFGDIMMLPTHARAFVWENKNDKMRTGFWGLLQGDGRPWSAYTLVMEWGERIVREWRRLNEGLQARWAMRNRAITAFVDGRAELRLNKLHVFCVLRPGDGALLPRAGGAPVSYDAMLKQLREQLRRSGVGDAEKYALHSMRRGKVADMRDQGVPEELIREQGGWKSLKTMHVYYDWDTEFMRRAASLQAVSQAVRRRDAQAQVACAEEGLLGASYPSGRLDL